MMHHINAENKKKSVIAFFTLLLMIIISRYLSLRTYMDDDVYFVNALNGTSIFDFIKMRYLTWSGRYAIELLMVSTINFHVLWKIAIPASILLLAVYACKLAGVRSVFSAYILISLASFFSIPEKILKEGALWITGYYNYLLPVALGFYSLHVLTNFDRAKRHEKFLSLAALIISCNNEQMAVITILSCISFIAITKNISAYSLLYLIITTTSSLILLLAPGNSIRFLSESSRIPEFSYYGIIDKIGLGLDRFSSTVSSDNTFIAILFIISVIAIIKKYKSDLNNLDIFSISSISLFLAITKTKFISSNFMGNGDWSYPYIYITYSLSLIAYVSFIYVLFRLSASKSVVNDYIPAFSAIVAPATVIMIGFSPTVYASADRVLFVFYALLMIVLINNVSKLLTD